MSGKLLGVVMAPPQREGGIQVLYAEVYERRIAIRYVIPVGVNGREVELPGKLSIPVSVANGNGKPYKFDGGSSGGLGREVVRHGLMYFRRPESGSDDVAVVTTRQGAVELKLTDRITPTTAAPTRTAEPEEPAGDHFVGVYLDPAEAEVTTATREDAGALAFEIGRYSSLSSLADEYRTDEDIVAVAQAFAEMYPVKSREEIVRQFVAGHSSRATDPVPSAPEDEYAGACIRLRRVIVAPDQPEGGLLLRTVEIYDDGVVIRSDSPEDGFDDFSVSHSSGTRFFHLSGGGGGSEEYMNLLDVYAARGPLADGTIVVSDDCRDFEFEI